MAQPQIEEPAPSEDVFAVRTKHMFMHHGFLPVPSATIRLFLPVEPKGGIFDLVLQSTGRKGILSQFVF